jgi:hypothetical protein
MDMGLSNEKPRLCAARFASMTEPQPGWMETLERALTALTRSSDDPVGSLRVLRTLTWNVHEFPHDARYRKVSIENTSFQRRVWSQPGGKEACFALGWHHVPCDDGAPSGVLVLPAEAEHRVPDAVVSLLGRFLADARGKREATLAERPASPLGYHHERDPPPPPTPGSHRDEYLKSLHVKREAEKAEHDRVVARVEDDKRSDPEDKNERGFRTERVAPWCFSTRRPGGSAACVPAHARRRSEDGSSTG